MLGVGSQNAPLRKRHNTHLHSSSRGTVPITKLSVIYLRFLSCYILFRAPTPLVEALLWEIQSLFFDFYGIY